MSDTERERTPHDADSSGTADRAAAEPGVDGASGAPEAGATPAPGEGGAQTELEILRGELAAAQAKLADAERRAEDEAARALRARAEADTARRLAAAEQARARDAGFDAAVAPVMTVYDDLRRALQAAEKGDPAGIVPGVRAVLEGLERALDRLDVRRVGDPGDGFDPDLHEALTSVPAAEDGQAGTIAEVFEAGFSRGERLIRPARVVVYQSQED